MKGGKEENLAGWLWVSPWVIGFLAFLFLPIAASLLYSFSDFPLLENRLWVGLDNYIAMAGDAKFWTVLGRTLVYAGISIPVTTIVALVIAAMLNSRVRGAGFFQTAVYLPTLVPMAASGMIWLWIFNGDRGLMNAVVGGSLDWLGGFVGADLHPAWLTPTWLASKGTAMAVLVVVSLWGVGQMVVVYIAAMREVPEALYEAAAIDGMGPTRRFLSITIPMISPAILFNVITLSIAALQIFAIPYIFMKATPGGDPSSFQFYTTSMYDNAFTYDKMGLASAMAWVQLVFTLVLTGVMISASKRMVHYRAA